MTNVRLNQGAIEGVIDGSPNVRLSQLSIEVLQQNTSTSSVLLSQVCIEMVSQNWAPSLAVTDVLTSTYPQFVRGLTYPVMKTAQFSSTVATASNAYTFRLANYKNPIWHWTLIYNYVKDNPADVVPIYAPETDYRILEGFFDQNSGEAGKFLFYDPSDNYVGPAMIANPAWRVNWMPLVGAMIVVAGYVWQATTVSGPTGWSMPSFSGSSQTDGGVTWTKGSAAGSTTPNPDAQLSFFGDGDYWYAPIQRNFGGQFLEDVTDLNTVSTTGGSVLGVFLNGLQMQNSGYQVLGPGLSLSTIMTQGLYVRFNQWQSFQNFSTGNLFIDPNGHLQKATTTGTTGALSPDWSDSGGYALDGTVLWQDLGLVTICTAQFNFFFRVRFETDSADFEQFLDDVWTVGGPDTKNGAGYLKLETARPNPLAAPLCSLYAAHHF